MPRHRRSQVDRRARANRRDRCDRPDHRSRHGRRGHSRVDEPDAPASRRRGRPAPPDDARRIGAMTPIAKAVCGVLLAWAALAAWSAHAMGTLVPPYAYPAEAGSHWDKLAAVASRVPTVAVVNPDSGPGPASDPNYAEAIAKLRAAGGKAIGYVSTRYAQRPLSEVAADINRYRSFYQLDGFFIDEMASDDSLLHVQYYQSIYGYVKALSSDYTVVGNPGTHIKEVHLSLPTADTVVVFEGDAAAFAEFVPDDWAVGYGPGRFAYLLHGADAAQMTAAVRKALRQNAGYLYVTDDTLPNPWDRLPSYWDQEVSTLLEIGRCARMGDPIERVHHRADQRLAPEQAACAAILSGLPSHPDPLPAETRDAP